MGAMSADLPHATEGRREATRQVEILDMRHGGLNSKGLTSACEWVRAGSSAAPLGSAAVEQVLAMVWVRG
jgi:hypothetical protein